MFWKKVCRIQEVHPNTIFPTTMDLAIIDPLNNIQQPLHVPSRRCILQLQHPVDLPLLNPLNLVAQWAVVQDHQEAEAVRQVVQVEAVAVQLRMVEEEDLDV
jgi:hypothetical protein